MQVRLQAGGAGGSKSQGESPIRRPALWCGIVLIILGVSAAGFIALQQTTGTGVLIFLLVAAGAVEALAGILDHHAGRRAAWMDVLLGLLSVGVGGLVASQASESASSLVYLITIWLLARGLADLLGSALMPSATIRDARLIRASVDLILGLLSWIALQVVPWMELLIGWPESSISVVRMLACLSVLACGIFLLAEASVQFPNPRVSDGG